MSVYAKYVKVQNYFMHAAIPGKTDYKEFLSKFVCNTSHQDAMLHSCDSSPNLNEVEKYLLNLFEESNFGTEDSVNFKQLMQKERGISLVNCTLTVEEFVKEICNKFNKLRAHHFIVKAQSAYLSELKEKFPSNQAIILLDFTENYSFIGQGSAQGYLWNNS